MPKSALEEKIQEIRYRDRIIVILFVLLAVLVLAYLRFPSTINIHRIPDPGRLLSHQAGDTPKTHVYSFTRLALETIYNCGSDCEKDIPANVNALRAYVTESCRSEIKNRVDQRPNLYRNRSRELKFLFNAETQGRTQFGGESPMGKADQSVKTIDDSTWHVDLSYGFVESVGGYETINTEIFYPVRIVRSTLPKNVNEYQLAFDCFYDQVVRETSEKES